MIILKVKSVSKYYITIGIKIIKIKVVYPKNEIYYIHYRFMGVSDDKLSIGYLRLRTLRFLTPRTRSDPGIKGQDRPRYHNLERTRPLSATPGPS